MWRMVSWFILIIMLTSVRGWDFQKIFNLSDGLVPLRNGKMQIPFPLVNGHAKPKSSDKTYPTNQPKRNSTTPSNKGQFLVPWVPHLAKISQLLLTRTIPCKIQILWYLSQNLQTLKKALTMKTVLLASIYHSPTERLKYAPQYCFQSQTYPPTPKPTTAQSYKPVFNFFSQREQLWNR